MKKLQGRRQKWSWSGSRSGSGSRYWSRSGSGSWSGSGSGSGSWSGSRSGSWSGSGFRSGSWSGSGFRSGFRSRSGSRFNMNPITTDWLKVNSWRQHSYWNDRESFWRLPISLHKGHREFMESSDDLCIDLAPVHSDPNKWHVWVAQNEPRRHIHVRYMTNQQEVIDLYEGLTGVKWGSYVVD